MIPTELVILKKMSNALLEKQNPKLWVYIGIQEIAKKFFSWIYHIAEVVWGFKGLKLDESGKIDELLTRPIHILCILSWDMEIMCWDVLN